MLIMNIEWIDGPHSQYIMIAFGISLLIVVYCALVPMWRRRALLRDIRVQHQAENLKQNVKQ